MRRLVPWLSLVLLSVSLPSLRAFVFFQPTTSTIARWNVNSPLAKPSAVNPSTKAIRYYIASDAYSTANRTNEINAIRAAFDQWQSVSGTTVKFEFAGLLDPAGIDARFDNTNIVFWAKKSLKVAAGTEDLTGRRALAMPTFADDGTIVDADIVLNGIQYQWFTDATDTANQAQFVEDIVLHEIGHLLGLDHSTAGGATVIDAGNGINSNAGLSADDIAAVRFLYPGDSSANFGNIRGTVRLNGAGILGAAVIAEDAFGNIAGATITRGAIGGVSSTTGSYVIHSLPPGSYTLRVTPLDPSNASVGASLQRASEIAFDYRNAVTSFLPSSLQISLAPGESKVQDFDVAAGDPVRIIGLSKPAAQADVVTTVRYAVSITQGQSNYFVGVNSAGFQQGATLMISGDGLIVGPTIFYANKIANGLNSLVVPVSVSSNATPGLRSFVVSQNGTQAYANGYLEIAPAVPDFNFDRLDDRFQRKYWQPWTSSEAAPVADPDNDGFSNAFEYRINSNPVDPFSGGLFLNQPVRSRFGPQLTWASDPGKRYQVYKTPTLAAPAWEPFGQVITATGEILTTPITFDGPGAFFRLELKR